MGTQYLWKRMGRVVEFIDCLSCVLPVSVCKKSV